MAKFNIVFDETTTLTCVTQALRGKKAKIKVKLPALRIVSVEATDSTGLDRIPGVVMVEEEVSTTVETQWQNLRIGSRSLPMESTYRPLKTGKTAVVYLIDSGIDTSHYLLQNSEIQQLYSYDGTWNDSLGHGTVLATLIVGVSPDVIIRIVKIPTGTSIPTTQILMALDAIKQDHENNPSQVKIINCSWIVGKSQILDTKFSELEAAGLIVVAAAGNQSVAADTFSPVGLDSVLGIGASDAYDRVLTGNWGPEVDITAPGVDVITFNANKELQLKTGSSLAAAIASGVLAQLIEQYPTKTATEIQDELIANSLPGLLFRDEAIYSTTPNRLLHSVNVEDASRDSWKIESIVWKTFPGDNRDIVIPYQAPVETIELIPIQFKQLGFIPPTWISLSGDKLHLSPPPDIKPGRYSIFFTGHVGEEVIYKQVIIPVYNDPSELIEGTGEHYLTANGDYIILKLQFCTTNEDCDAPMCCLANSCSTCKS